LYYDRHCSGMRTLVAVSDDFILGTGTLVIEQKFIHSGGRVGKIEDVAVHPDNQRIGIGKLIVRKLIELASEAKCYKVILSCSEKNVAFYKRTGFRKHEYTMRLDL
jgi:glucosamine-phosphate N-acetyltransferase